MRFRLKDKTGWTDEKISKVVKEYFRFIALIIHYHKGNAEEEVSPSLDIDETWHNHMLFSRDYIKFSKKWHGDYIHHQPSYKDEDRPGGYNIGVSKEENEKILHKA